MAQPLKQIPRTAAVAWCSSEAAPTLLALGTSSTNAAATFAGGAGADPVLELVSYNTTRPGTDMEVVASFRTEGARRFSSLSWGSLGADTGACPYGVLAAGMHDGVVNLYNPSAILKSQGADTGLIHSRPVHQGNITCVEFHPTKPSLIATCGVDSEVNIISLENPAQPDVLKPSTTVSKHAGTEVLCCSWNRTVAHILASCSNAGTTVLWDLKAKKEVISFKDPANRQRCSAVVWNPDVATQLLVAYDDDRQPSMQMWDLRNCQYPFKETAGHSKGILGVEWCPMDPNLLISCGKDNKLHCWCLSSGTPETFCEMPTQQGIAEVRWAPHRPGIVAAAAVNGSVSIHSVQTQQSVGNKYCPKWYSKPCGLSFGFGAKMLAFGTKKAVDEKSPAKASWCHSLVVPNEPEIVPAADAFERWIADRQFQQFCHERTQQCGGAGEHEGLMWQLVGAQFDQSTGRKAVPKILGFSEEQIMKEAEQFLGKPPGTTLMGPKPEEQTPAQSQQKIASPQSFAALDPNLASGFFAELAAATEQKEKEEELAAQQAAAAKDAAELAAAAKAADGDAKVDWSAGPEAIIKRSLLVGNLTAAVECCFKSGLMAEALLLASGGGPETFLAARNEYLRLRDDPFLTTVGNIMKEDFETLVGTSDLGRWKETLAIVAEYSGTRYQTLCLQLGERLEKEKFDIRSAVNCYICAGDFLKTIGIWVNTHVATQGSQKLALQGLVEKMAVLQDATKFSQADPVFNAKVTSYAEMLANSGRLTPAMRYLTLLRDDASSAILRDRIYNSAPQQMSAFGRQPAFPFDPVDVRILHQAPNQPQAQPQHQPGYAAQPGYPQKTGVRPQAANTMGPGPAGRPNLPTGPGPTANVGQPPTASPTASMPPAPRMGAGMPPAPNMGSMGCAGGGMTPMSNTPGAMAPHAPSPTMGMPPAPRPAAPCTPAGFGGHAHGSFGTPTSGPGVMPQAPAPSAPVPGRPSSAPQHSAAPVTDGMPVAWPLPTSTQQKLSTTSSVADANQNIQSRSAGQGNVALGEAMDPHDLTHVRNVFTMLLDASSQDGNMRKREDNSKKLEELYSKLQAGWVKNETSQRVLSLVKAVEAQDYPTAHKCLQEMTSTDWDTNRNWLTAVRRLVPTR